ncbi:hypothetical protein SRABI84_02564 [Peribacillus simplex]|nr:hypothetical protein SRABI84_02564 [Peribacillus simplex]
MIRKGKYAIHNGSEYSFSLLKDKSIRLISNKHADLSQGFKHLDENIYIKNVSVEEVENLFKINSKAIYKGELFPASEERKTGKVLLDTIQQTLNSLKRWGLNEQINICTPNLGNGMKWR